MAKRSIIHCYLILVPVLLTTWLLFMIHSRPQFSAIHRWNSLTSSSYPSSTSVSKQKVPRDEAEVRHFDSSHGVHLHPSKIQQLEAENKSFQSDKNTTASPRLKIILMWSTWLSMMADEPLVKAGCPVTSCLFTSDVSLIYQSDVVVLYIDTLTDLPLSRQPHQRFVFAQLESPVNTKPDTLSDPRLRYDYFNWTMTYRRDSDIILRDYYGSLIKISEKKRNNTVNGSSRPSRETDALIRGKSKLVAWFVGHCSTPIRREEYVRQLSQFVPVDIFGQCSKECPSNCDDMLRSDYKFYLAFENSWCPDYVTEKFIRPLEYDAVPIVLGGADYSRFAPAHSYIDAREFGSAKQLADYLMLLNESDALYARYFDWKKDYGVTLLDLSGWCDLCRMAHDESLPRKIYPDIMRWWMSEAGECETNSTKYF